VKFNIAVAAALVVAIIAFLIWNGNRQSADDAPVAEAVSGDSAPVTADGASNTEPAPIPAKDAAEPPSFDVVRISPEGAAVIAGRAEPGAEVQIFAGDTVIAEVTADARGEWAVVPEAPIAPGPTELSLTERTLAGETIESESVVVLAVPERQSSDGEATTTTGQEALAVMIPKDNLGATVVLQAPETGVGLMATHGLTLDTVEYDDSGRFALGGRASPGSPVIVYLDNEFFGSARGGNDTKWHIAPDATVEPGLHSLRVDLVDEDGVVLARIETPFVRADFTLPTGHDSVVVVQPGNSLWRLARRSYGNGVQYVTIFEANRDQIADPDLIYPGQIFLLPSGN
jgi:nucleoid-associated protein YgaU